MFKNYLKLLEDKKCWNYLLYGDVISLFAKGKCQKIQKKKKEIRYYRQIKSFYLSNNLRIFNEIFRKNLPYDNIDNIKSHNKQGFTPPLKDTILEKPKRWDGRGWSNWPLTLFRINSFNISSVYIDQAQVLFYSFIGDFLSYTFSCCFGCSMNYFLGRSFYNSVQYLSFVFAR